MHAYTLRHALWLLLVLVTGTTLISNNVEANDKAAFWKLQVKGDFAKVLANVKTGLEGQQFVITGEENLSKGLETNKKVFGEDKWNTIGFQNVTAVHFCSLAFNQEVFNLNMDWSVLCPFKLVVYNMKAKPDEITIVTVRPSYLLKEDHHKKAKEIGKKMEDRIVNAIKEGASR